MYWLNSIECNNRTEKVGHNCCSAKRLAGFYTKYLTDLTKGQSLYLEKLYQLAEDVQVQLELL